MHGLLILGGSGGIPPRKILKSDVLRLNLEAFQGHSHAILHSYLNANVNIFIGHDQLSTALKDRIKISYMHIVSFPDCFFHFWLALLQNKTEKMVLEQDYLCNV